jgi:hypothetical protein
MCNKCNLARIMTRCGFGISEFRSKLWSLILQGIRVSAGCSPQEIQVAHHLFLLVSCFTFKLLFKTSEVLNIKISSTSLCMHTTCFDQHHYLRRSLIFWWNCCASVCKLNFWDMPSCVCPCVPWYWAVNLPVLFAPVIIHVGFKKQVACEAVS